ncbi:serine/threonine-protein kinase haspin-like isoform X2 [Dysidea avara]|uniref:serine/threonine-protein kinase haspin-like isoform X2 n=1 Tax=Dysidea avara TaxID=196820 RepID=UPI0033283ECF
MKTRKIRAYGRACRLIKDDGWDDLSTLNQTFSKVSLDSPLRDTKDIGTDKSTGNSQPTTPQISPSVSNGATPLKTPVLARHQLSFQSTNSPILSYLSPLRQPKADKPTPRDSILSMCAQTAPMSFDDFISRSARRSVKKLGEGVYSEVFYFEDGSDKSVLKVIPIEGKVLFNGEKLKTFEEILPEMAIAQELSNLGLVEQENCQPLHFTQCFLQMKRFALVQGHLPDYLVKEWERWDHEHKSENDHPRIFGDDQLFILFESENGGTDLEHFEFHSGAELMSVYHQVVAALAVAEKSLQFEHRDLHWVDGVSHKIQSEGMKVTIIDFTLSRLRRNECVLFFDLETISWLFEGHGDYQFEVYRMMRNETKKDWEGFYPNTNVYWLEYLVDKLLKEVKGISFGKVKDKSLSALRRHRTMLKRSNSQSAIQVFLLLNV